MSAHVQQLWLRRGGGKADGVEVPERAEYLRIIMGELARGQPPCFSGFLFSELGNMLTGMIYAFEEREHGLDLWEGVRGRMMVNYFALAVWPAT